MNTKPLKIGTDFENDTYYLANKDFFDVSLSDTIRTTDQRHFYSASCPTKFMDVCILLQGKKNITLDFGGATLYLRGRIQPFIIDRCENVTLKNVRVEFDRPFATELEISKRGDDYIALKYNPKHPCRVEDGTIIAYSDTWESEPFFSTGAHFIQTFDRETLQGCGLMCAMIGNNLRRPQKSAAGTWKEYVMEDTGKEFLLKGPIEDCWQVGRVLAFCTEARYRTSVFMFDSICTTIENYQIVNGCGMGFFPIHCKDLYFKNIKLLYDEKASGIIQNTADALHAVANSGDFVISDTVLSGMIDDAFNIHGAYYLLESFEENIAVIGSDGWVSSNCNAIDAGDVMAVHKPGTVEIEEKYNIVKKEIIDEKRLRLTLDRPLENHQIDSVVENFSANPNIVVKNSKFLCANSHMRLQSRGKIVMENCETELPILLSGDVVYWYEASPCKDVTIRNVRFTNERANIRFIPEVLPTEKEPYYHENIRIEDCSFVSAIPVEGCQGGNLQFMGCTNTTGTEMNLKLVNFGDVKSDCAKIENKLIPKTELNYNYR